MTWWKTANSYDSIFFFGLSTNSKVNNQRQRSPTNQRLIGSFWRQKSFKWWSRLHDLIFKKRKYIYLRNVKVTQQCQKRNYGYNSTLDDSMTWQKTSMNISKVKWHQESKTSYLTIRGMHPPGTQWIMNLWIKRMTKSKKKLFRVWLWQEASSFKYISTMTKVILI